MDGSFEARLRAFDVELQSHVLQSVLHEFMMTDGETHVTNLFLNQTFHFHPLPHLLPPSSPSRLPVAFDWLPKRTNHLRVEKQQMEVRVRSGTRPHLNRT